MRSSNVLNYIAPPFHHLASHGDAVVLIVDEIHVQHFSDSKKRIFICRAATTAVPATCGCGTNRLNWFHEVDQTLLARTLNAQSFNLSGETLPPDLSA